MTDSTKISISREVYTVICHFSQPQMEWHNFDLYQQPTVLKSYLVDKYKKQIKLQLFSKGKIREVILEMDLVYPISQSHRNKKEPSER